MTVAVFVHKFFHLKIFFGFSFLAIFLNLGFPLPYGEIRPNLDTTDILVIFSTIAHGCKLRAPFSGSKKRLVLLCIYKAIYC